MITIDASDPTPPFEQIRQQLADQIRTGEIAAGTRLPSVRQLAGDLRIANGTVVRAYSELEAEGLLESNRSGTRVREVDVIPAEARDAARTFVSSLRGLSLDDAISAVRAEWARTAG